MVLNYFIVSNDVERSRRFYADVLGGKVVFSGVPMVVALANSSIVINLGGGPTDDKPAVTLETPRDPDRVSSFLNIRVKDIAAVYADWSARGAQFLTPPKQHEYEIRCYVRDPDGHLIEVGQPRGPRGGLGARSLAIEYARRGVRVNGCRRRSARCYASGPSGSYTRAICAAIGVTGAGMSAMAMRSFVSAAL